jgi:hypothetical protein
MEYIEKQFPFEYVENDWDNFLSEKVNGERVRYFKYFCLIPCDDATEGCINAFKKLQILSNDVVKKIVDTNFGRTFFNISYKIVDGFEYLHYNGRDLGYTDNEEYVKRHYPRDYTPHKLVHFNLKVASFEDDKEESFSSIENAAIRTLEKHISEILGFERFSKVNSALTKVNDKDEYLKKHPLTDKFGIPIEIGDIVATGAGAAAIILQVTKMNPSTINWGVSPATCIIVRAKDPNKKLGW